ncbi:MAG: hypothetical protein Q9222_000420 [Ikaeria aurantiellina]
MQVRSHPASRKVELLSVQITAAAVATLFVGLRLISRFLILKNPGWDDYIIAMGALLGITQTVLIVSAIPHGAGMHMADIHSTSDLTYILKMAYVFSITAPLVMLSVKASLLLLYLRISPRRIFRRCVLSLLILFTVDAIIFSLLGAFECSPIDRAWIWNKPGHCKNWAFLLRAQGLWSLAEDIVILLFPMPTIWKLQMPRRRKTLLLAVFATGLVYALARPCAAVITRIALPTTPQTFVDFTWWLVELQNWGAVESGSGMICASLILLKPLIQIVSPKILGVSVHGSRRKPAAVWPGQGRRLPSAAIVPYQPDQAAMTPILTAPDVRGEGALEPKRIPLTANRPRACSYLEFSFLLNASLDVFELRTRDRNRVDQDLGMLHAVDERLSIWGWETGTGTKFAVVVDMWGRDGRPNTGSGIKGEDIKPVFKALQTAYIRLLQNPFYTPDDYTPMAAQKTGRSVGEITSKKFIDEVKRIGETWRPGLERV